MTVGRVESRLESLVRSYGDRSDTGEVLFTVAAPRRDWTWSFGDPDRRYFVASITKLHTSAIVMQLVHEERLELDAPIDRYLPSGVAAGLNVADGVDRSPQITVRHLLAHTSGIADYFEQKRSDGSTTFGRAVATDVAWSFDDVLRIAKEEMAPRFAPGERGKASYSDTNYQLLGAIIETITGDTYAAALEERIFAPLDLRRTYLFARDTLDRYDEVAPMLYGTTPLHIPLVMASVQADGGVVSTTSDSLRFLQAFMEGELFPHEYLRDMQREWRRIFFPLQYGTGIMRYALPRWMTFLRSTPVMVGHSGASGAVCFYAPKLDTCIVGTVNQLKSRSLVYQLMTRMAMIVASSD